MAVGATYEPGSVGATVAALGGHNTRKSVIVMDEIDGCGNADKGGITALNEMIRHSQSPVICICNNRLTKKV